jgi:large subunit ribosomal protein L3
MKFIIGRKIGMTRIFDEDGRSFAVTKIAALPCFVSQVKDKEKNRYKSVQVSAYKNDEKKKVARITEFKEENIKKYKKGDEVTLKQFAKNETVTIEGVAKGKGFAGTIKRHGFAMGPVSHGSRNIRKPGSIGGGYPERVVLGRKMGGHMGGKQVTVKNLKIADVDKDIMLIVGSIPGPNKSILKIYGKGEKAEEVIDFAAEEERIAQEKMLEADKEAPKGGALGSKEEKIEANEEVEQPKAEKEETEVKSE